MNVYLGIDLGSTTSKAVFIDENQHIIGRGITNTRANYEVATEIARMEAEFNSRFTLLHRQLKNNSVGVSGWDKILPNLENRFHYLQFRQRLEMLIDEMRKTVNSIPDNALRDRVKKNLDVLSEKISSEIKRRFSNGELGTQAEFFRDVIGGIYLNTIMDYDQVLYDQLSAVYDHSITPIENQWIEFDFRELVIQALDILPDNNGMQRSQLVTHLDDVMKIPLEPHNYIGTGYGRQLLPFAAEHIKSEILCHAMGAHAIFPETRTVLDIGGQDTKAIQVDANGYVTSFQMNDRCAAGCGRYLGYIADEMNISVSELGPLANDAEYETNICSTCTVFAGAELREYLNLGEKKENILAGLHKAIVQRAFALLARSGGVRNEFTFTGGVARNTAVVKYVKQLIFQNYGELTINTHPDSIFMGALGAALFSQKNGPAQ